MLENCKNQGQACAKKATRSALRWLLNTFFQHSMQKLWNFYIQALISAIKSFCDQNENEIKRRKSTRKACNTEVVSENNHSETF